MSAPSDANTLSVRHNRARKRFETESEGLTAFLEYSERDGVWILTHTFVSKALRGRGIAGILTQSAIEIAERENRKVDPQCSYAAAYLQKHPEYGHLRAG